jgi:hypothetical protein
MVVLMAAICVCFSERKWGECVSVYSHHSWTSQGIPTSDERGGTWDCLFCLQNSL